MKNVKILLLLGVMLVNVMPYIKDGKIEWKAAQAKAQYYTIEDTGLGIYICGEYGEPYTIISSKPCEDLNPQDIDTTEAEFKPCYCANPNCGVQKEYCDEPCPYCGNTGTVNEDGNDYATGGTTCKCSSCGRELSTCGSQCSNAYCPSNQSQNGNENGSSSVNITLQGSSTVRLMEKISLTISASGVIVNNVKLFFENEVFDNGSKTTYQELARTPGYFNIRALINNEYYSNLIMVNVTYPNASEIKSNNEVASILEDAKNKTLEKGRNNKRVEYGACIYANTIGDELLYFINDWDEGAEAPCGTRAGVNLRIYPDNPMSILQGGLFHVASFHSHPSISMCDSTEAPIYVGPSDNDFVGANWPEYVYDYVGDGIFKYTNTPLEGEQKIYTYGSSKREN